VSSDQRIGKFSYPPCLKDFQQVDETLRNRCRFIPWSEEHPAWAKQISTVQVEQLRQLLADRAEMMLRIHDAREHRTLPELLATATDQQRSIIVQVQQVLDQRHENEHAGERDDINNEIAMLAVQKEIVMPFLNALGVLVDAYGFAWIAKTDHYFRVNTEDTQVYLFMRDDPEVCCRVCLVADTRGKDVGGATGFNARDLLLLSKIIAIEHGLLPPFLAAQVDRFVATRGAEHGKNIFSFDPIDVFQKEFQERYPEIYEARLRQREKEGLPVGPNAFCNLRNEMLAELHRLRQLLYGG